MLSAGPGVLGRDAVTWAAVLPFPGAPRWRRGQIFVTSRCATCCSGQAEIRLERAAPVRIGATSVGFPSRLRCDLLHT